MAEQHLRLLDDAVRELNAAHERFAAQKRKPANERSLAELAPATRSAYLALEKIFKHALATLDPYLVYGDLKARYVQNLVADVRRTGSPSRLAAQESPQTLNLQDAWGTVQDLGLLSSLSADQLERAGSTIKRLIHLRRRAQHAELWEDPSTLLQVLEELFAQILDLAIPLEPRFEEALRAVLPNLPASLRAIKEQVDAGWITLRELVQREGSLTLTVMASTELGREDADPRVTLFGEPEADRVFFGQVLVPRAQASGLFLTFVDGQQAQARNTLMTRDLPLHLIPDSAIPPAPPPPPRGLLAILAQRSESEGALAEAFRVQGERQRLAVERFGLLPLEGGRLVVPKMAGWMLIGSAPPALTVAAIALNSFVMEYVVGQRVGRMTATLTPSPMLPGAVGAAALSIEGSARLKAEYVVSEATADKDTPAGTVRRLHHCEARITT